MGHGGRNLGELPERSIRLAVQHHPVGDDDDRVEGRATVAFHTDELAGQPGYGVGLAAARRVLDAVSLPGTLLPGVGQQLAAHVHLVVAGPDLPVAHFLSVVLDDVGEARRGQDFLLQVGGLYPARVASAAVGFSLF